MSSERKIDRKGRVTIPKSIREQLAIEPGASVSLTIEDGRIVIQHDVDSDRAHSLTSLRGCITEETKRSDADPIDPIELKQEWTTDLPN